MRHRSRTGTVTAKATAIFQPVSERRRFFGVAPIVNRWAAATNRPSVSEPRIGRSGKWRLVSAVAMTNRRFPPTRNQDFGKKNNGSSIRMLYTSGGKGGGGGEKYERVLLHFLERLRSFNTSGPVGRSVTYFILFQVFHIQRKTSGIDVLILLSEKGGEGGEERQ